MSEFASEWQLLTFRSDTHKMSHIATNENLPNRYPPVSWFEKKTPTIRFSKRELRSCAPIKALGKHFARAPAPLGLDLVTKF